MPDERDRMLKVIWKETSETTKDRKPIPNRTETTKTYDTSAIYDDPADYMTTRGIFKYAGVEIIKW